MLHAIEANMRAFWTGDVFYVIEEGTFTIFKIEGQELARVSKGSCFGELALLRQVHKNPSSLPSSKFLLKSLVYFLAAIAALTHASLHRAASLEAFTIVIGSRLRAHSVWTLNDTHCQHADFSMSNLVLFANATMAASSGP